jgi:hypothetical protein
MPAHPKSKMIVELHQVIKDKAIEYKTPYIVFEDLITLCRHAIRVYGVDKHQTKISFETLCIYCSKFIATPFGKKILLELADKVNFYS